MTTILFGQRGDFFDRHQGALLVGLFLLIATSEWMTSAIAAVLP